MNLTVQQKHSRDGIVKPGEMIEIRHSSALTLHDRRVLNLLIEHAGSGIVSDERHTIPMLMLRAKHKGGERVRDSIVRLMTTLVEVPTRDHKGNRATLRMAMLASTTTTDDEDQMDGEVTYTFSREMREIIARSQYWGRIKAYVMFAFTTKYALALYELLCLRGNLHATQQDFTVKDFRHLLGVPDGKLEMFPQLKQKVLTPAVEEINGLSDFNVTVTPIREGGQQRGKLTGFRLKWERKEPEEWRGVLDELGRAKVGRRARLRGMQTAIAE